MIAPKETQALERLKNTLLAEGYWQDVLEDVNIIENTLNEYYRLLKEDDETTKNLKALEIIKEKEVNVFIFLHSGDLVTYNDMVEDNRKLTDKEYNALKEVLDL